MSAPASSTESAPAVSRLVHTIRRRFGLDFGGQRFPLLLEGLCSHGRDPEHTASGLLGESPARLAGFIEHLANGETYFLRHPTQLEAIHAFVLERAAAARDRGSRDPGAIQAWCAGCSTGEEPLSLAMTLLEARDRGGPSEIKILATDLSGAALNQARAAAYGEWSFRGVPDETRNRYFQRVGRLSTPVPTLRAPIAFEHHNLLRGPPGGSTFDLVLCRNVLIYFDRPALESAFATFREAVRPGGLLVLGPAEGAARVPPGFFSIDIDGVILYQREDPSGRHTRPRRTALRAPTDAVGAPRSPDVGRTRPPPRVPSTPSRTFRPSRPSRSSSASPPAPTGQSPDLTPIPPLAMARLAADQGRHDDARALLSPGAAPGETGGTPARSQEDTLEALVILALVELDAGHLDAAAAALDEILAAKPESLMGTYLMGSLLQALGRKSAADEWYRGTQERIDQSPGGDSTPVAHSGGLSRAELSRTLASLLGDSATGDPPAGTGGPRA